MPETIDANQGGEWFSIVSSRVWVVIITIWVLTNLVIPSLVPLAHRKFWSQPDRLRATIATFGRALASPGLCYGSAN